MPDSVNTAKNAAEVYKEPSLTIKHLCLIKLSRSLSLGAL